MNNSVKDINNSAKNFLSILDKILVQIYVQQGYRFSRLTAVPARMRSIRFNGLDERICPREIKGLVGHCGEVVFQ